VSELAHVTTHFDQWRIEDFSEGDAAEVWGGAPSGGLGLGAEPLAGYRGRVPGEGFGGGAKPPEKLSTFCDTTNNLI